MFVRFASLSSARVPILVTTQRTLLRVVPDHGTVWFAESWFGMPSTITHSVAAACCYYLQLTCRRTLAGNGILDRISCLSREYKLDHARDECSVGSCDVRVWSESKRR